MVAPVYSAGEEPIEGVEFARPWRRASGPAATATRATSRVSRQSLPAVRELARAGDFVVFLGAGNITQWAYASAEGACRGSSMIRGEALLAKLGDRLAGLRGRITPGAEMEKITWFRAGGAAEALFQPADEEDLAAFLKAVPEDVPLTVVGIGSNLLVREGGIPGFVIRLSAKGFGEAETISETQIRAGAATPDKRVAAVALEAGIGGFHFYHGIPGGIGGALRMNAGANGVETRERVVEVRALDRQGNVHTLSNADMGYAYRHSSARMELIFTSALFEGYPEDKETIRAAMEAVQHHRETVQPIREKTGGSTFKNPGHVCLEGDRQGRLPRPDDRRRADVADALQFHDQHRHRDRLRSRISWRNGAGTCAGKFRHPAALGDQADRQFQAGSRGTGIPRATALNRNHEKKQKK